MSYPSISEEETRELIYQYQNGDESAKAELLERHRGLVAFCAKSYLWACNGKTLIEYQDLIQEGTFGLNEAIKRFSFEEEVTFSTYAKERE